MAIPDFQSIMLPLLKFASDEKEHSSRETIDALARKFDLNDLERKELLPSRSQAIFDNRVAWAKAHFKAAGFFESPKRGFIKITKRGLDVLLTNPPLINIKFLRQFPEYVEALSPKKEIEEKVNLETSVSTTPEESIEFGYQKIRKNLETEILSQVKKCSAEFFERLVVELLVTMGYGGSRLDAGRAIGKSGDGGIDGIIKEDKLGLDVVYLQAKRWDNTVVGRPEIQKFVGALAGQKARKGVFITTSTFSSEARDYVSKVDTKIVLIDGEQLAQFMIDHNVGVTIVTSYEIKRIDSDYFMEE